MEQGMKKRIDYLDIAKGIAMISIVLGHLGVPAINRVVFTYHLPIFYLISGYFLNQKKDTGTFIRTKFRNLIVPYYFICVLICLLSIPISYLRHLSVSDELQRWIFASLYASGDTYQSPFFIPHIGAIWFLWATFWAECGLKLVSKRPRYIQIPIVLLVFYLSDYIRQWIWLPLSIQAGGCALLFMYIGYLIKEYQMISRIQKNPYVHGIFLLVCLILWGWMVSHFTAFWLVHGQIGHGWLDIIGSICGCYLLLIVSKGIERWAFGIRKILLLTGKYSLLFLAVHIIELDLFPWYMLFEMCTNGLNWNATEWNYLWFRIIGKLLMIGIGTFGLKKSPVICRIFGYEKIKS